MFAWESLNGPNSFKAYDYYTFLISCFFFKLKKHILQS